MAMPMPARKVWLLWEATSTAEMTCSSSLTTTLLCRRFSREDMYRSSSRMSAGGTGSSTLLRVPARMYSRWSGWMLRMSMS